MARTYRGQGRPSPGQSDQVMAGEGGEQRSLASEEEMAAVEPRLPEKREEVGGGRGAALRPWRAGAESVAVTFARGEEKDSAALSSDANIHHLPQFFGACLKIIGHMVAIQHLLE
ncbi:hypothetical protein BRADI_1g10422v3 [Brachypodium distachyon]|uniref:Uncharacterized protein n=1 Tax=Brachypodium distachyon TaxID=15368 RepID=A0A2K2DIW7_BRADI|nr:hypothetical protein BRADI_1g10422v3 [Brachypodium distachyon]